MQHVISYDGFGINVSPFLSYRHLPYLRVGKSHFLENDGVLETYQLMKLVFPGLNYETFPYCAFCCDDDHVYFLLSHDPRPGYIDIAGAHNIRLHQVSVEDFPCSREHGSEYFLSFISSPLPLVYQFELVAFEEVD